MFVIGATGQTPTIPEALVDKILIKPKTGPAPLFYVIFAGGKFLKPKLGPFTTQQVIDKYGAHVEYNDVFYNADESQDYQSSYGFGGR